MNYYEVLCYINGIPDEIAYEVRKIIRDESISVKQSWEHGYHLRLFGYFNDVTVDEIVQQLSHLLSKHPTPIYDEDDFKRTYEKNAMIINNVEALRTIYQNKVILNEEPTSQFDNKEQLNLNLDIHHIFDKYYAKSYWQKSNHILQIVKDMFPFAISFPTKIIHENPEIESSGFISHLSHIIGFMHSLNEKSQEKILSNFQKRRINDLKIIDWERYTMPYSLSNHLLAYHQTIKEYIDEGILNFFSPNHGQLQENARPQASKRHEAIYQNEIIREKFAKDSVLCTNRWILNVLYEKLVLLQFTPLEKFYFNYLLALYRYPAKELEVI